MSARFDYSQSAPGVYTAMDAVDRHLTQCRLDDRLLHLVRLRVSQVNGCAYCIDMHWKDLRAAGESEQRLYSLGAWRECPWYSARERAALAWAEAVTRIAEDRAPDSVHAEVQAHFDPSELCELTLAVAQINSWNRLSIASRLEPGSYVAMGAAS